MKCAFLENGQAILCNRILFSLMISTGTRHLMTKRRVPVFIFKVSHDFGKK